jgi:hydroxypyruvate isomerase
MKPVICIDPLYQDQTPEKKIERVAQAGFHYIEFWGWRDKNIPSLVEVCQQHQVEIANFSGHRVGSPVAAETHDTLLEDVADAVKAAQKLNCRTLMVLTNDLNDDGSVRDSYDEISNAQKHENTVTAIKKILKSVPKEIHFVLEPLNTKLDHPGYYLADMKTASSLVETIEDPRLKILCDLYHLGMMGNDPEEIVANYISNIGYFHIADVPGRHEPGTGTVDWKSVLRLIKQKGYEGFVGFEYFPQTDSDKSLNVIKQLWEEL